jgi:hypothetical protein
MILSKKMLLVASLCAGTLFAQSFAPKPHDDDKATNLKILPKDISDKDLHNIMKSFSMSLGVRCNFCHVAQQVPGQDHPKFDFASDDKQEKIIARKMMMMTSAINENYIGKMIGGDHALEQIKCVTCHMGRQTPIVSVDSLAKP